MKKLFLLAAAIIMVASQMLAASGGVINCRGRVLDEKGEPVIGATVLVPGTTEGTSTNIDGMFLLKVKEGTKEISIQSVGYKPVKVKANSDIGDIKLEIESTMLNDVVITSSVAKTRVTPVAISEVSAATIDMKLGNQ